MALLLIRTAADGTTLKTTLPSTPLIVDAHSHYTIIDSVTGEAPMQLRLTRIGGNLVVEMADANQQLVQIDQFFEDNAEATFATDGSVQVAQTTEGYLVNASSHVNEGSSVVINNEGSLVWEGNVAEGAESFFTMPVIIGGVAGGALLLGGGGSSSSSDDSEVVSEADITGSVADGYIENAQLYADVNGDGIADASELLDGVVTDVNGNFTLSAENSGVPLLAVGGTNVDTGLPNTLVFGAPTGTYIINPLTTLLQAYIAIHPNATAEEANTAVQTALSLVLPSGETLSTYDPIAENNVEIQAVAAQIVEIAANAESTTVGSGRLVFANLASAVDTANTNGTPLDLSDVIVITDVVEGIDGIDEEDITGLVTQNTNIDDADDLTEIALQQEAPVVALTSNTGLAGDLITNVGTLNVTAKQANSTIEYSINAGTTWSTDFTAVEGINNVQVREVNANGDASTVSEIGFTLDTSKPTVTITDDTADVASGDVTYTFTFSEKTTDFILSDITLNGGTAKSELTTQDNITYTLVVTPIAENVDIVVSVAADVATDIAGNTNTAAITNTVTVDTTLPTVDAIDFVSNRLDVGETTTVTITFSEAVDNFSLTNISAQNGDLSNLTSTDNIVWTATLTPTNGVQDNSNMITVSNFTDQAGNIGANETSSNYTVGPIDTTIVVFDLTTGNSSDHSGRTFDASVSYEVYIIVDSDSSVLSTISDTWKGGDKLSGDDTVFLVGDGAPIVGKKGGAIAYASQQSNDEIRWAVAGVSDAANLEVTGIFARNIDRGLAESTVSLFTVGAVNTLMSGTITGGLGNVQVPAAQDTLPVGILTSQGLV